MTQLSQNSSNKPLLVKVLKKSIKKIVSQNEIKSATRNGNKQLDLFLAIILQNTLISEKEAEKIGNLIGYRIVELSQKQGKKNLDNRIIRQLSKEEFISPESLKSTNDENKQLKSADKEDTVSNEVEPVIEEKPATTDTSNHEVKAAVEEEATTADTSAVNQNSTAIASDNQATLGLKERLAEDLKVAMKAKDKIRLETIRSIKKVLLEKEVSMRPSGQETLTTEQEIELLAQQAKQRRESIEQYRKGGREDLAEKEAAELAIIETYLPAQLSQEKLNEIIEQIITELGASSPKDMGKVMGAAMKQLKGQADGKQIQEIVKEKLN